MQDNWVDFKAVKAAVTIFRSGTQSLPGQLATKRKRMN